MKPTRLTTGTTAFRTRVFGFAIMISLFTFGGCNQSKTEVKKEEGGERDVATVKENNSTVAEYVTFVENDANKMSLDHQFTNEALQKLAEAVRAMANEVDYNVEEDLGKVEQYAEEITKDPFETTHADNIRKSADVLTGVLEKMQKEKFPDMQNDIRELKQACGAIKPDVLTLEQKSEVKSFFNKAADVLEKMN